MISIGPSFFYESDTILLFPQQLLLKGASVLYIFNIFRAYFVTKDSDGYIPQYCTANFHLSLSVAGPIVMTTTKVVAISKLRGLPN